MSPDELTALGWDPRKANKRVMFDKDVVINFVFKDEHLVKADLYWENPLAPGADPGTKDNDLMTKISESLLAKYGEPSKLIRGKGSRHVDG